MAPPECTDEAVTTRSRNRLTDQTREREVMTITSPEQTGVTPDVATEAEQMASALNLLASFIRTNPDVSRTFRWTLDRILVAVSFMPDPAEAIRQFAASADPFGFPVKVDTTHADEFEGIAVNCGAMTLRVYADAKYFDRPIGDYLPEVSA